MQKSRGFESVHLHEKVTIRKVVVSGTRSFKYYKIFSRLKSLIIVVSTNIWLDIPKLHMKTLRCTSNPFWQLRQTVGS